MEEATEQAISTWNREPMFHISSPLEGWKGPKPNRHHDFINIVDFPDCWRDLSLTVEVEAKAKEVAILKLMKQLSQHWCTFCGAPTARSTQASRMIWNGESSSTTPEQPHGTPAVVCR